MHIVADPTSNRKKIAQPPEATFQPGKGESAFKRVTYETNRKFEALVKNIALIKNTDILERCLEDLIHEASQQKVIFITNLI